MNDLWFVTDVSSENHLWKTVIWNNKTKKIVFINFRSNKFNFHKTPLKFESIDYIKSLCSPPDYTTPAPLDFIHMLELL